MIAASLWPQYALATAQVQNRQALSAVGRSNSMGWVQGGSRHCRSRLDFVGADLEVARGEQLELGLGATPFLEHLVGFTRFVADKFTRLRID